MIKNKQDYIKKLSVLRPEDAEDIQFCMQQMEQIITTKVVSEDSVKTLYNVITLLSTMKERHMYYLISWLKQGYMED